MTGFQKACLAAAERALGKFGLRPTCEIGPLTRFDLCEPGASGRCIRLSFEATQHECEIFLYPDEVSIRCQGYVHVPVTDAGPVRLLDRTLTELLEDCASGLGPQRALMKNDVQRQRRTPLSYAHTLDPLG